MAKKLVAVLLFGFLSFASVYAQKFTKREQLRREAREKYYFCGNMFTITAGYNHAWLTPSYVELSSASFGVSEKVANTREAFNIGFLWDYDFKKIKPLSFQLGAYYSVKGGEHLCYYDNHTGEGPQLLKERTKTLRIPGAELQGLLRYSFLIKYDQRVTINAGPYISKFMEGSSEIDNWDVGAMVGIGYDFKHLSASVSYQPGGFMHVIKNCNSKVANISVNIGYRIWKK